MQRIMRGRMGEVVKERLPRCGMTSNRLDGVICEGGRREKVVGEFGQPLIVSAEESRSATLEGGIGNRGVEKITTTIPQPIAVLKTPIIAFKPVPKPNSKTRMGASSNSILAFKPASIKTCLDSWIAPYLL